MRKKSRPTAPPVGAAVPAAHMTRDAPHAMDRIEFRGDEYADVPTAPQLPPARRSFRITDQRMNAHGSGDIALGDSKHTAAEAHLSRGKPDPRRNDTAPRGNPAAPQDRFLPGRESRTNKREDVEIVHEPAPARPRAGFTGSDPTRTARFQIAFLLRPFDALIAQHPGSVEKVPQPSPTAARPPQRRRLVGGLPNAAGVEGTGMAPVAPHRNTVRQAPRAWDASLNNRAATVAPSARVKGWRAR